MNILLAAVSSLTFYAQAGLALDINPPYATYWGYKNNGTSAVGTYPYRRPYFVSGPMARVSLGLEYKNVYAEANHLSAAEDGFNGSGINWLEAGVRIKFHIGE